MNESIIHMNFHLQKITIEHTLRLAIIYARQSSLHQVEFNRESTERQLALALDAEKYGWDPTLIKVFDADLGKSGQSYDREDFDRLITLVNQGKVGAIFVLEASRLARSEAAWYFLLEICIITGVLIIDKDGIYDPKDFSDYNLLKLKVTWSHTELHTLKQRLHGGKLHKAQKGELHLYPPTGYVYLNGKLTLDPNEDVQEAIRHLFKLIRRIPGIRRVLQHLNDNKTLIPSVVYTGHVYTLRWVQPTLSRLLSIYHNPIYTGTYVYGRSKFERIMEAGKPTNRKRKLPIEEWPVIIHDSHPAYLTWDEFMENEHQFRQNTHSHPHFEQSGIAREGSALLQGFVICGVCGHAMSPHYQTISSGLWHSYGCIHAQRVYGDSICWSVPGAAIDKAVESYALQVFNTDEISLSLAVLKELESDASEQERQWELRLKNARDEAQRAEQRHTLVDPKNRLVARELELRWNEKLQYLSELEQAHAQIQKKQDPELSYQQQQQILQMVEHLPIVLQDEETTVQDRKEILRLLIKQVSLTPITEPERLTQVKIRWWSDAVSEFFVKRPSREQVFKTPDAVIEIIRQMPLSMSDAEMAEELNRQGLLTGKGLSFNADSVARIRSRYNLPKRRERRG